MKLLHIIASANPADGGAIEGVRRLGDSLRALGHQQELLTLDHRSAPFVKTFPAPVHAMGPAPTRGTSRLTRLRRWARLSPEALGWLRCNLAGYDGVIVDGLWNYATHIARRVLPGSGVPYIVFPHGMLDPWFAGQYRWKHRAKSILWRVNEGPLLAHAHAAAFTTRQELALARSGWSPWRSRDVVVGYGTAAPPADGPRLRNAFASAVPGLGGTPFLLFLGRLHEKKGIDLLIGGFARAAAQLRFDLVIAGPGKADYVAYLQARADAAGLGGRIHWPGMLGGDAKWGALHACDGFVLTSHQENFGVAVAEALGCAKPVIISDAVNIAPDIVDAGAGVVCAVAPDAIADALTAFGRMDQSGRAAMGARGLTLFDERYRIERVAERLVKLFEEAPTRP